MTNPDFFVVLSPAESAELAKSLNFTAPLGRYAPMTLNARIDTPRSIGEVGESVIGKIGLEK